MYSMAVSRVFSLQSSSNSTPSHPRILLKLTDVLLWHVFGGVGIGVGLGVEIGVGLGVGLGVGSGVGTGSGCGITGSSVGSASSCPLHGRMPPKSLHERSQQ